LGFTTAAAFSDDAKEKTLTELKKFIKHVKKDNLLVEASQPADLFQLQNWMMFLWSQQILLRLWLS
jgi:hypothetical protein